jgi:hypothetical protein
MEPSNQELKEILLQYNITDKDIKGHGKNGTVLKSDRLKVYKKYSVIATNRASPKKVKMITVNNKQYSENDLAMMIQFYEQYHNNINTNNDIKDITQHEMNKDTWLNVLLQSDMDSLKTSCSLNKTTNNLCHSDYFWEMKFEHDNLPLIMSKYPIMVNEWIKEYTKINNAYHAAYKFVNYIIKNKRKDFYIISFDEETYNLNKITWLPADINDMITKSIKDADRSLNFDVKNLFITYMYTHIDNNGDYADDYTEISKSVTKENFIIYLSKMFYHFPTITMYNDDGVGDEDIYLTYNELLDDQYMKNIFKLWI